LGLARAELSILLTDDPEIRALNRDYRGIDSATDVLSFPMEEEIPDDPDWDGLLGDVVISVETAQRQAAEQAHRQRLSAEGPWGLPEELLFLLIHGVLHLMGHDHADREEEEVMRRMERRLWQSVSSSPDR
jgi:probable rRNA maturation factor